MEPVLNHKDTILSVDLTPLVDQAQEETYVTADISASSSTLTVKDIDGFSTDQILLIGELGQETAEIIKTHASTSPSGTTVTLDSNTEWAHDAQTRVRVILFDQVEFSHASTESGSKTTLDTKEIQADQKIQTYEDTTQTSGYYFARFKETVGDTYGGYSDAIPYGGWSSNTVGYAIKHALTNSDVKTLNDRISREWCYREINRCLKKVQGKLKRMPQYQNFNAIVGQAQRGTFVFLLPSDIYDDSSNRSIVDIRVGDNMHLNYLTPREFEERLGDAKYTQVRTQASSGDTSLAVDNSYDFDDGASSNSPSLTAYISGSQDDFTYTGVTRDDVSGATAAFTGIPSSGDNSIENTLTVDTYIFQDEEEGEPDSYTIRNGNVEIYPLPDGNYDNMNLYADYWTVATEVDSDGDVLDVGYFDMVIDWLTWKMRMINENNGKLNFKDGDYVSFKESLNDMIRNTPSLNDYPMRPNINRISYGRRGGRVRPDVNE